MTIKSNKLTYEEIKNFGVQIAGVAISFRFLDPWSTEGTKELTEDDLEVVEGMFSMIEKCIREKRKMYEKKGNIK